MLLDCPSCARSYHVSRAELDGGRSLICPRCDARWLVDAEGRTVPFRVADPMNAPARTAVRTVDGRSGAPFSARLRPAFAVMMGAAIVMTSIGARERLVRAVPRLAALYETVGLPVNVRGLALVDVTSKRLESASGQVTIAGEIRNVAARRVAVPRLAYEVRDESGHVIVTWSEKAPTALLGKGRNVPFASLPHLLPDQARSVMVRFDSDASNARIVASSAY